MGTQEDAAQGLAAAGVAGGTEVAAVGAHAVEDAGHVEAEAALADAHDAPGPDVVGEDGGVRGGVEEVAGAAGAVAAFGPA